MPQVNYTECIRKALWPKLTATRGAVSRIDRLARLFDEIAAATGDRRLLLAKLVQLDHDANDDAIAALWRTEPTTIERQAVDDCWAQSGEGGAVRHLVEPKGEFDL